MKLHSHTKKQLIAILVMAVIFLLIVLYSKGYFDLTFIDRPINLNTPDSIQDIQNPPNTPEDSSTTDDNNSNVDTSDTADTSNTADLEQNSTNDPSDTSQATP